MYTSTKLRHIPSTGMRYASTYVQNVPHLSKNIFYPIGTSYVLTTAPLIHLFQANTISTTSWYIPNQELILKYIFCLDN